MVLGQLDIHMQKNFNANSNYIQKLTQNDYRPKCKINTTKFLKENNGEILSTFCFKDFLNRTSNL